MSKFVNFKNINEIPIKFDTYYFVYNFVAILLNKYNNLLRIEYKFSQCPMMIYRVIYLLKYLLK